MKRWRYPAIAVFLLAAFLPSTPLVGQSKSGGGTTASVSGTTVNITVTIDLILPCCGGTQGPYPIAEQKRIANLANAVDDYWNSAFANYPYRGCAHLHLDLVLNLVHGDVISIQNKGRFLYDVSDAGNHTVTWQGGTLANVRPVTYDPSRDSGATGDYLSPYQQGLPGIWSDAMESTRDFAHEVGHFLGLGDDYQDVTTSDGATISQSLSGREGTLMDDGDMIDQNLVNRVGDLAAKSGVKLPQCWTGALHMQLTYGAGCSTTVNAQLALTVDKDGVVGGTSKGGGTYFRAGCGGADLPANANVPVSGHLTGGAFQLSIPIGAPLAYDPVTVQLTSPTTAHAQTTDVSGIRTYTIDLACSGC